MAATNKLTVNGIKSFNSKGRYSDGGNLYLNVDSNLNKNWLFIYRSMDKRPEIGLGAFPSVSLQDARKKAIELRLMIQNGQDPKSEKILRKNEALQKQSTEILTFEICAEKFIDLHKHEWVNIKHTKQWGNTLKMYAYPVFGHMNIQDIDTDLVLKVIEPIWFTKTVTANRVRGRIEKILDWAKVRKFRAGDNPARWKGHLELTLPNPNKISQVEHHAAIPYIEIPSFYEKLCRYDDIAAMSLRFAVLTAVRTQNARLATWDQVDIETRTWKIHRTLMKKKDEEHRIPLSDECVVLLDKMKKIAVSNYIFPGIKEKKPINENALLNYLKKVGYTDFTVHGFRSTFKDWATEEKDFSDDLSEMALAHVIKNATKAAYKRGDLFEKRRNLMNEWADYCIGNESTK
jgi:integrase